MMFQQPSKLLSTKPPASFAVRTTKFSFEHMVCKFLRHRFWTCECRPRCVCLFEFENIECSLLCDLQYKAWRAACELSKEEAMHKYIELAREHNKESVATLPKHQTNAHRQSDGFVVQSRPVLEEETAESNAPALIQELQHEKNHAIEMLKSNSSLLFERDDSDMTALHWAADRNAVEFLKVALAIDEVDIDVSNANGETPLYMAAFCGHAESVQLLVDAGADPHKKNNDDESPVDVGNRKCRSLMLSLDEMTSEYAIADSGSHTSLSDESDLGLSSDDELLVNSIGR
ncbi:MAG: hypothetical protein MHM6MM_002598 [Cercozoa sp. M6MM]